MLILCRRLAFPSRLCDLAETFGMSKSAVSEILLWEIDFLVNRYREVLTLDTRRLTAERIAEFAAAIRDKGAPVAKVWGFIDGTFRKTCRPSLFQRVVFSGHKRAHGLKFQAVVTPDGLISHVFGPIEGRHHDAFLLAQSGLPDALREHSQFHGYFLYGDKGYYTSDVIISGWRGAVLSEEEKSFNASMSSVRIAVEWQFGHVVRYWHHLDLRSAMKIFKSPVANLYTVGVLLANCHTCITRNNQTSQYFGLSPPSLREYLHPSSA